jgi:hypothetical protein
MTSQGLRNDRGAASTTDTRVTERVSRCICACARHGGLFHRVSTFNESQAELYLDLSLYFSCVRTFPQDQRQVNCIYPNQASRSDAQSSQAARMHVRNWRHERRTTYRQTSSPQTYLMTTTSYESATSATTIVAKRSRQYPTAHHSFLERDRDGSFRLGRGP